jgi:outer membrane protein OmpA-like peptidoglycan-associated protein
MKLMYILLLFLLALTGEAQKQAEEITAVGKVTHSRTGKGVRAMIAYKSMPTGSISGRFNDSTFTFPIFGTAKYQITAEAKGFIPRTVIVDPKDIDAQRRVVRNILLTPEGETITLSTLIFEQGKAVISPKSFPELDEVVAMMNEDSKMEIQLEGHTDNSGNAKTNMKISEDRVEVVKKYLVSKGIGKDRVKTKAFGGTKPLSTQRSAASHNLNRRVELRVLKD